MPGKVYTAKDIEQIMLLAQDTISLNTPITTADGDLQETELGDLIEDQGPGPEEEAIMADRQERLAGYLRKYLNPREQKVIALRFGFEDGNIHTLEEISREYGVTREWIRQIEARALRKLRISFLRNKITRESF